MRETVSKRALLTALGAVAGTLAGCHGPAGLLDDDSVSGTRTDATHEGDNSATQTTEALNLREANVVDVMVESTDPGHYRFDETLHHDDGEDGYANWWQVESLDGTRLGRRDLLHAHGNRAFTRSETVDVPEEIDCVVAPDHDETHGYGGQAVLVALDSGAITRKRQGGEKRSFVREDCPNESEAARIRRGTIRDVEGSSRRPFR